MKLSEIYSAGVGIFLAGLLCALPFWTQASLEGTTGLEPAAYELPPSAFAGGNCPLCHPGPISSPSDPCFISVAPPEQSIQYL